MRGENHLLAITVVEDELSGETKPLFAFPIQICAAVEGKEPRFDVAAPSGAPRKQVYVDELSGEMCEDSECPRGVRIGDEFHPIPDEAIEQIKQASKIDTMVALGTIPVDDVPFERATGTYFVQSPAKGGSPKAYRLVYEALRGAKKSDKAQAIVTKRTSRSRQKLCVIYPDESLGCLVLVDLRFAGSLRQPDEQVLAPQAAEVATAQVNKARQVVASLGDGALALEAEVDEVLAERQNLIEQALAGETIKTPTPIAATVETDNLESLLEASLATQS